jgi:hypothetical protein
MSRGTPLSCRNQLASSIDLVSDQWPSEERSVAAYLISILSNLLLLSNFSWISRARISSSSSVITIVTPRLIRILCSAYLALFVIRYSCGRSYRNRYAWIVTPMRLRNRVNCHLASFESRDSTETKRWGVGSSSLRNLTNHLLNDCIIETRNVRPSRCTDHVIT